MKEVEADFTTMQTRGQMMICLFFCFDKVNLLFRFKLRIAVDPVGTLWAVNSPIHKNELGKV
jgi:hypothetical protein